MTQKTMNVEVLTYKDVRGKELLYLRIKDGENEVLINVGDKTYKAVKELIEPPKKEEEPTRIENGTPKAGGQTQEELKAKVLGNMPK
jgi:hypothetical protein